MIMSQEYTCIDAINPKSEEIEFAVLYPHHFGPNHHGIRFEKDGINAPYYSSEKIPWEYLTD